MRIRTTRGRTMNWKVHQSIVHRDKSGQKQCIGNLEEQIRIGTNRGRKMNWKVHRARMRWYKWGQKNDLEICESGLTQAEQHIQHVDEQMRIRDKSGLKIKQGSSKASVNREQPEQENVFDVLMRHRDKYEQKNEFEISISKHALGNIGAEQQITFRRDNANWERSVQNTCI